MGRISGHFLTWGPGIPSNVGQSWNRRTTGTIPGSQIGPLGWDPFPLFPLDFFIFHMSIHGIISGIEWNKSDNGIVRAVSFNSSSHLQIYIYIYIIIYIYIHMFHMLGISKYCILMAFNAIGPLHLIG